MKFRAGDVAYIYMLLLLPSEAFFVRSCVFMPLRARGNTRLMEEREVVLREMDGRVT